MAKEDFPIYYEKCNKITMPHYPFFIGKLSQIQKLVIKIYPKKLSDDQNLQSLIIANDSCQNCEIKKLYKLGNIIWANTLKHKIEHHKSYPSEFFVSVILNTCIVNNNIINPPIELEPNKINIFKYIPLHHNKLQIIDALMHQGSQPRYILHKKSANDENISNEKYLYSEHSGVLMVKNKIIKNVIVSAETARLDIDDENIFLPINADYFAKYEYLFHTHPNASQYAGRINEGILYEFPSANDLFNFVKYHNEGKAQASLVVAPEGSYVIRPIKYQKTFNINHELFYHLRKFILKLEKMAVKKFGQYLNYLSDPDTFHKIVGADFTFIKLYNRFIEPANLYIEFYPRTKKNGEWSLRQISLPYLETE